MRSAKITAGILIAFILLAFGAAFVSGRNADKSDDKEVAETQTQQKEEIKLKDNQAPAGTINR